MRLRYLALAFHVLFERLGAFTGVATAMGKADIVDVVSSAPADWGEVFERVGVWVGRPECPVDGESAEATGLVAGVPFGFDELGCGVAFRFCFCSAQPPAFFDLRAG